MDVRRRTRTVRVVWTPSLARRVVRHRALWAIVALGLLVIAFVALADQVAAVDQERTQWGETTTVVVLTKPVAVGELFAGSTESRTVPRALVPDTAVSELDSASRAKVDMFVGETVLLGRVTSSGERGLPQGSVALTLPVITHVPLVREGDLVDLYMIDSANLSSHRVAHRVVVLALGDGDITVAIDDTEVATATVASLRPISVVLVG